MSDQETEEQEPSIEEILSSIRQIISDDEEEGGDAPAEEAAAAEESPAEAPEEDVVELTEKVEDEAPAEDPMDEEIVPDPEPEPEPVAEEPEPDPEPEPEEEVIVDMQDAEPEEVEPEPVVEEVAPEPAPMDDEALLTSRAEDAAYEGFKELAAKTAVDSISGVTIEQIVREEIRPMLRVWLDQNLPNLVERLVQEELDRVAKRALED